MDTNEYITKFSAEIRAHIEGAYRDGIKQGTVTTCAIIYQTFSRAGLEADNLLFDMLRDLAKKQGDCDDLEATVAEIFQSREEKSEPQIQS